MKKRLGAGPAQRLFCGLGSGLTLVLTLVFALATSSHADANQPIIDQFWFEDRSAELTIDQVRRSDQWIPYQGLLSQGYGTGALWIKARIQPKPDAPLVLSLEPVYLDRMEIYDDIAEIPLTVVGDQIHPKDSERIAQSFSYTLAPGAEPVTLYFRLTSTSTRQVLIQALTESQWQTAQLDNQLGSVFYVVALFVLLITAVISWQVTSDRLFGAFALSVATALAYGLSVTGLWRLVWPTDWPAAWLDGYQSFFSIAATTAAILFHLTFLSRLGLPRWAVITARVFMVYQMLKFVLLFAGATILALTLNLVDVLIAPILTLLFALVSGRGPDADRSLPHWMVVSLYVMLLSFMLIAALPGLGLVAGPTFSLYVVQINALATTVLILAVLQCRHRRLHAQRREFQAKALAAEQAVEKERFARAEQQKLLDMLAHELKTPLAVIRLRLEDSDRQTPVISKAIGDMSTMIERCLLANQAEDGRFEVNTSTTEVKGLIHAVVSSIGEQNNLDLTGLMDAVEVETDPHWLSVILINLIENAIKYGQDNEPITVQLAEEAGGIAIEVANRPGAAGWPDPHQVFNKYYRSSHARRQSGTGLGLFLAQSLATLIGAELAYAPTATHVQFRLWIPGTSAP